MTISGDFAKIADASHTLQSRTAFALLNDNGTLYDSFNAQINVGGTNLFANAGGQLGGGNYGVVGKVNYAGNDYGFAAFLNSSGVHKPTSSLTER